MARVWLVLMLCFFPVTVSAQEGLPRIDWAVVFAQNPGETETKILEGGLIVEELKLPDGAFVQRHNTKDGIIYDVQFQSAGDNADQAGCLFTFYLYQVVRDEYCPEYADTEKGRTIIDRFERISKFVGDNSVPPVTGGALSDAIASKKAELRDVISRPVCKYLPTDPFEYYSGMEAGAKISKALRHPRLPVMGNCL